jgi:hypothetical protein
VRFAGKRGVRFNPAPVLPCFDQEPKSDAVNGEVCTVGRTWRAKIRRQAARFAGDPDAKLTESH